MHTIEMLRKTTTPKPDTRTPENDIGVCFSVLMPALATAAQSMSKAWPLVTSAVRRHP